MHFEELIQNLKSENSNTELYFKSIITSYSGYFISKFYIGDEPESDTFPCKPSSSKLTFDNVKDIIKNDIIFVQVDYIKPFFEIFLPCIDTQISRSWTVNFGKELQELIDKK